jgi:hypothetical protein
MDVGASVGMDVGAMDVGDGVGADVGASVGADVGAMDVGEGVGTDVGASVGMDVGAMDVGERVVGRWVGARVAATVRNVKKM